MTTFTRVLLAWPCLLIPLVAQHPPEDRIGPAILQRIREHQELVARPLGMAGNSPHTGRYDLGTTSIFENKTFLINVAWFTEFDALPFLESDLVVLASVSDAESLISKGNTAIFSRYNLQIIDVLRSRSFVDLMSTHVIAERLGGVIKLPGREVLTYLVPKQAYQLLGRSIDSF